MQSSESKGRRAAFQSAQSEGSSSSELEDQVERDRYLSAVRIFFFNISFTIASKKL